MHTGGQKTVKIENRCTYIRDDLWLSQTMYYACPIFAIVFPVKSCYLKELLVHTK